MAIASGYTFPDRFMWLAPNSVNDERQSLVSNLDRGGVSVTCTAGAPAHATLHFCSTKSKTFNHFQSCLAWCAQSRRWLSLATVLTQGSCQLPRLLSLWTCCPLPHGRPSLRRTQTTSHSCEYCYRCWDLDWGLCKSTLLPVQQTPSQSPAVSFFKIFYLMYGVIFRKGAAEVCSVFPGALGPSDCCPSSHRFGADTAPTAGKRHLRATFMHLDAGRSLRGRCNDFTS